MPSRAIIVRPSDGRLYRLAEAIDQQSLTTNLAFPDLAAKLCAAEAGEREVDIAQMSEILARLQDLASEDPAGVADVVFADL